jgi:hypothetical protein
MRHRGLRFGASSMISVELAEAPWLGAAFKLREFTIAELITLAKECSGHTGVGVDSDSDVDAH